MRYNKQKQKRTAVDKVMAAFNRLSGQTDDRFDKPRPTANLKDVRQVSVDQEKSLFHRCVEYDFDYLMGLKFAASREALQYLLPQSVLGRARQGHGGFIDPDGMALKFTDASFDHICTILEAQAPQLSSLKVRGERNRQIERLSVHLLKHLGQPQLPLEDSEGPLWGVEFLAGREVATEPFLKGMVLAARMDEWAYRLRLLNRATLSFAGELLELGGGDCLIVKRESFSRANLGDCGARVFEASELAALERAGVIAEPALTRSYPAYDQVYFRRCDGLGVSDDLALLYLGQRYGPDAMLGGFVMDAVDSYDKFLLRFSPGGMDARLATKLMTAWQSTFGLPLVQPAEVEALIRFAAKRNTPATLLSSSHRRLIQYEPGAKLPTLLHHQAFLEGRPLSPIKLGFARVPSTDFYTVAQARFAALGVTLAGHDRG